MSDSLQPRGLQHARLPCPSLSPKVCSNSRPLSQWCHSALSSSFIPFPLALSLSQHQGLFQCVGSSHQVATILELQLQHQSFQWISSVQFSLSVIYDSLQPHGLQHARLPCPSPTPGACSNLCPSNQWCHLTISSSVIPFSSCLESFPASGSFPMSQFFASSSQSIGASASPSVLPMSIQDWFLLVLTSLISLQSKGLSVVFSSITVQKHQFFSTQLLQSNSHIHIWLLEKPWIFRINFHQDWIWFDLAAQRILYRTFSRTTTWKHQIFGTQPSLWSHSHIHTWLLEKPSFFFFIFVNKVMSCFLICCLGFFPT